MIDYTSSQSSIGFGKRPSAWLYFWNRANWGVRAGRKLRKPQDRKGRAQHPRKYMPSWNTADFAGRLPEAGDMWEELRGVPQRVRPPAGVHSPPQARTPLPDADSEHDA